MRYLLIAFVVMISANTAYCRGISAGLRTGMGNTLDIRQLKSCTIDKTWDKELFVRYETKGKWAFEAGAIQYNYNRTYVPGMITLYEHYWPTPTQGLEDRYDYNYVDVILSAQYDISCSYLKDHCPFLKKLSSYIGVNIGASYANIKNTYTEQNTTDGTISKIETRYNEWGNFQLGLSHTLVYDINRFFITSTGSYMIQPTNLDIYEIETMTYPNSKLSLRLGVGYRF